jgi:hypothetical protein
MTQVLPSTRDVIRDIAEDAKTTAMLREKGRWADRIMKAAAFISHTKPRLVLEYGAYQTPIDPLRVARGLATLAQMSRRGEVAPVEAWLGAIAISAYYSKVPVQVDIRKRNAQYKVFAKHWLPIAKLLKRENVSCGA